jgi:DNA-binding CsgD family transcriptional regulator
VTAGQLLERRFELERIADALARVAAGTGTLVVVEGAAGVGKTELLRNAVGQGRVRQMRTLCGHGVELEQEFPFGVARQMFGPLLREVGVMGDTFRGPAGLVRPLLEGSLPSSRADGEFPFLHGFFWLVGNLAESGPVVLAVDDAHWCDAPSLRALLYLIERLEDLPACLVVAIRTAEPGTPTRLVAELMAHSGSCTLRPAPLSRCAVAKIVRGRVGTADESFVEACAEVTGGNPFLLSELLAAVDAEAVTPTAHGAAGIRQLVPRQVLDATLVRLARFGPEATALSRALAVLGGGGELRVIARIAGIAPDTATTAACDALAANGLLRQDVDCALSFAHPLLRSAVYAGISGAERGRMHRIAARVLSDDGKDLAVVAAQLLTAEHDGDPWAVELLRRAARAALAEGAPISACRYLQRALAEPPPAALRGEVLAELASAGVAAGEPQATQRLREALDVLDDVKRRTQLRITLANALIHRGEHLEAASVLEAGSGDLGGADRELELELEATWISAARMESSLRARAMPRLAELCRELRGETPIERVLLAHEANRRVFAGDPLVEVRDVVCRAWAGGALVQDQRPGDFAAITALAALGWCDDFDAYEEGLHALQADARRRGLVLAHADATYGLHLSHHYRGRLADAVADAETAIAARRHGWRRHLATASSQLCWTLIELDDLDGAARVLQLSEIEEAVNTLAYALVHDARGRLAAARGEAREALGEFLNAGHIAESAPIANPSYLPWRSSAGLAASRLGERQRARDLVAEELRRADRFGAPRPIGVALRAAGLIEGGDAGIDLLRAAVERLAASPAGLEHARALTDLGAALRRRGHRRDARSPLRDAVRLAAGFGATVIEHRSRSELVVAGGRPRRRQFSGVDALTPGERRVAQMAARGMSNREIAEALFVTVKAVHWHLGNTYRKVGVSSREGLAEILVGGSSDSLIEPT